MSNGLIVNAFKKTDLKGKRILIIGGGFIAGQYCRALLAMGIKDAILISYTENTAQAMTSSFGYKCLSGGYKSHSILKSEEFDLVIIALPIHELKAAADYAMNCGQKNILVEKPGSLYSAELNKWDHEIDKNKVRIRIAYNRLLYPNLLKLKELIKDEGGITSCRYTFTEWVHTINFEKEKKEVYERWGISNSLHVISMAHALIGLPRELAAFQSGNMPWHPSGSRFTGAGIAELNIPFSYHADWSSAGRWGIEVMTCNNAYQLIPLEELNMCRKGTAQWNKVEFESLYPDVKPGLAEEVLLMLCPEIENEIHLPDLRQSYEITALAEKIFGYRGNYDDYE